METKKKNGYRTHAGKSIQLMNQLEGLSLESENHFGEKLAATLLISKIIKLDSERNIKLSIKKMFKNRVLKTSTYCRLSIL